MLRVGIHHGCSTVPTDKGANAGLKVASLVAGMVAGADSIDDMALLRHGGMGRVFARTYAPSTLGSFLRAFTFGHVRQLDAVASRFLAGPGRPDGRCWPAPADGGAGRCRRHRRSRSTATPSRAPGSATPGPRPERAARHRQHDRAAPVVVAQRLRKGAGGSRAARSGWSPTRSSHGRGAWPGRPVLVRADSAFYGRATVGAASAGGAAVSVTVRMDASG